MIIVDLSLADDKVDVLFKVDSFGNEEESNIEECSPEKI